ncbi:MAG: D-2-hydroxyacid dehydrogenase [Verrucomicrobia bacterium]|nr:D-2-hydroxyacid dehydrogenase [Verrucomicrobiota bacterium]
MKIVVLDGYTLNPGDLSWEQFKTLSDFQTYDRTPPELTVERARDAEIIVTNKTVLDRAVIAALPRLRYIGVLATGYNVVDIEAARERGIPVTNVPEYSTANVAQAAFALLLELASRTGHHAQTVREGRWTSAVDFCYWDFPLVELNGLTLGIVGYGRIGRAVARVGRAFGMKVLASVRRATQSEGETQFVDLDTLLRDSDVITLHCPLTPETKELINAARLAQMKPTAFLINTARGGLVNEADLADALNHGRLAGAGLDVLSAEPPSASNLLLRAKNCIITPHIAWATRNARARLMEIAVENVRAWLRGQPQNVVNAAR